MEKEKVFLYGGEDINQVGFRVMYVLYKYDGLENVKRHYRFKKNKRDGFYTSMTLYNSKEEQLNRVFFTNKAKEDKFDCPFIFDGQEYFCSKTWYCEENQKNDLTAFPKIEKVKSLLEISYKDTFRLEKESGEWVFYGPSEYKEYIDELDLRMKSTTNSSLSRTSVPKNEKKHSESKTLPEYPLNLILYGPPGTGKSYAAKQIVEGDAKNTYEHLNLRDLPKGDFVRVTFHPDTDYASFVGCYKPSMNGKEIEYKFVPQAFLKIYVDAWKSLILKEKKHYYLIIEELNRGNCAQIFGDIFQLLDRNDNGYSDYYILADTDVVDYLKSDDGFGNDEYNEYMKKLKNEYPEGATDIDKGVLALPCNLTILATMNTSDQSLFPIDSAFKRRWEWKYVRINYEAGDLKDVKLWNGTTKWLDFIEAINKYIADRTHSADKQIGERFIKLPKNNKTIDDKTFRDKVMFYLFNDVFKDDMEFGKMVSGETSNNKIFLFENLYENDGISKIENFIAELLRKKY